MIFLGILCICLVWTQSISAQCDGPDITIASTDDAASISSCETYHGSIIIDQSASGAITLDGIRIISGNLTANNAAGLTSLTASSLAQIGGTFGLQSLTTLSTLNFPILTNVGQIKWLALPALQEFSNQVGISRADSVRISNTQLRKFSGFTLTASTLIDINNNAYLETVSMNNLVNVTESLSIQANAPNINLLFESLESAGNLTFRNISGLSLPSLADIQGSFACYSCAIATFTANNIQNTGGSVAFVSTDLQSLDFPHLVQIGGGLQLSNNSNLQQIGGFSHLERIQGSLTLNGNFEGINFASLVDVSGGATIETKSTNSTMCDLINQAKQSQVIKGKVVCQTGVSDTQGNSTSSVPNGDATSTGDNTDKSNELSAGVIAGIVLGVIAGVGVLGGVFFFVYRRRKITKLMAKDGSAEAEPLPGCQQLPLGGHHEKVELYVDPKSVVEMNGINGHGRSVPGLYEMSDTSMTSPTHTAASVDTAAFDLEDKKALPLEKL